MDLPFKGVDYVFHAAALKQVPSCEFFPMEAVKTNIQGTDNVIRACISNDVKKAVFLSTDKAVYPINAMGMTKALMEKNVIANSRNASCTFAITRYGNVMASRGSVIPLFLHQCLNDIPITVTNPDMTRFLMSLDQSVSLVMYVRKCHLRRYLCPKSPSADIITLANAIKTITSSITNHYYWYQAW